MSPNYLILSLHFATNIPLEAHLFAPHEPHQFKSSWGIAPAGLT